jgi:hypothetical protein
VVKAALPAAQAGDGRAAYKISLVLTTCAWELSAPDPEARLQQYLLHPNMPQWVRDMRLSQLQWCIGLVKKPPFGELPATPEYWMAQAYAAGDPLAQEEKAADAAHALMGDVQHLMSPTERAAKVQIVQDNLRAAVESGDPEVLFRAGVLMANPFLVTDTTPGNAVALAACDLGRDCTVANPICMQEGRCPAGQDFPMLLQQGMSPADYAKLYARSQQIVLDMRAGNYDAVLANLTITK